MPALYTVNSVGFPEVRPFITGGVPFLGIVGLTTTNKWEDVDDDADPDRYKSEYWYDANGNIDTLARFDQDGNQYDGLGYRYHLDANDRKVRNRLYQVRERADATDLYANDVSDLPYLDVDIVDPTGNLGTINTANNYGYDELGNLIKDANEEIDLIEWTVTGKVRGVQRTGSSSRLPLSFSYSAGGHRITKAVGDPYHLTAPTGFREHYIRDAQGNVMATYRYQKLPLTPEPGFEASLKLTERPIYGSARLGVDMHALELGGIGPADPNPYLLDNPIGKVHYELSDHLGNVTTVITDELVGVDVDDNGSASEYFQPFVVSAQGYEPFGSLLPGRNFSSDSYRFGFNGKEKDDEVHGSTGTSYDYGFRIYDPRVGRFLSIDPLAKSFPWYTPYQFAGNKPIWCKDIDGLEDVVYWKFTVIEPGYREQRTRSAKWSDLYPGEKHGPLGHGTMVFTTTTARTPSGIDVTSVTREQFIPPPPPASISMLESLADEVSSWFGGVWGTGGPGGEMREKGKGGMAWDPEAFMLVVDKLKKGFPDKFKFDKYKPGRQDETSDKLSEDNSGRHEGYAKSDKEGGPSDTGAPPSLVKVSIDSVGMVDMGNGDSLRAVIWTKDMQVAPSDTNGGVLRGNKDMPVTPTRTK